MSIMNKSSLLDNRRHSGMSLMEIMVALLILTIGLLGIASLQMAAIRSSTNAFFESEAIWYAYDIGDRMRANPDGITAGAYDAADIDGSEAIVNCVTADCAPDVMANYDLYEWGQRIATLPAGQGMIANLGDGTFTISVMWDEVGGATGVGCDPADPDDKTCVQITLRP